METLLVISGLINALLLGLWLGRRPKVSPPNTYPLPDEEDPEIRKLLYTEQEDDGLPEDDGTDGRKYSQIRRADWAKFLKENRKSGGEDE